MQGDKNSISKIYKDIRQNMLCSARLEASSGPKTKEVPAKISEGTKIGALSPLRRFGQVQLYSRLVSQSGMLQERSVQGCRRAKHKTNSPLDDNWVIFLISKACDYFRARRDEICFTFDLLQFVDQITIEDQVKDSFRT